MHARSGPGVPSLSAVRHVGELMLGRSRPNGHQDYRIILYNNLFNEKTPLFNLYLSSPPVVRQAGLWVFVPLAQTWFISLVVLPHVTYMFYMFHKINQSCRTRAGLVAEQLRLLLISFPQHLRYTTWRPRDVCC